MKIWQSGIELLGDVGLGVIKNSGRLLYGTGQALVGVVSEDDELIEQGVKNLGSGAMGLSFHAARQFIAGDSGEAEVETNDSDLDSFA
jgi:hypothetical protein